MLFKLWKMRKNVWLQFVLILINMVIVRNEPLLSFWLDSPGRYIWAYPQVREYSEGYDREGKTYLGCGHHCYVASGQEWIKRGKEINGWPEHPSVCLLHDCGSSVIATSFSCCSTFLCSHRGLYPQTRSHNTPLLKWFH